MKNIILKIVYFFYRILASLYIKKHSPIIIWVTWSVWKTSCRTIINQTFKKYLPNKKVYTSPKNFNSELWLVFSIFELEEYNPSIFSLIKNYFLFLWKLIFAKKPYDILVLEYWIDHPGDMDFLLKIAKPHYSVFTKLDFIHVENFLDQGELFAEKLKLIESSKIKSYLNYKDENLKDYWNNSEKNIEFFNIENNFSYSYKKINNKFYSFLKFWEKTIQTNLLWSENFLYLDLSLKMLDEIFQINFEDQDYINFEVQDGRFSIFEGINYSFLVDSSYNAWPESILKMIDNTLDLRKNIFADYKVIFVLWDMRELWENSPGQHKKIFQYASNFWQIISVWEQTWEYFWEHLGNFKYSFDAWEFLKNYLENSEDKYIVLFKWSQNTIFTEEAIKPVLKNKSDQKKLVRQDDYWMKKKKDF